MSQVIHGLQLLIHQAIQKDRARACVRPVKSGRIVVHADGFVGFPIHQPGGLMLMIIQIFIDKGLEIIKVFAQPFGIALPVFDNESSVLSQAGFVHIAFPGIARAQHRFSRRGIAFDPDGNPTVHAAVTQGIQYTALFVFKSFVAVFLPALFQQNLSQSHVAQPGIPIPKHVQVLLAAGGQKGIRQGPAGFAVHAFHFFVNVGSADFFVFTDIFGIPYRKLGLQAMH